MAVIIDTKGFKRAFDRTKKENGETEIQIVARSGSSYGTLRKLKIGSDDLTLNAIDRMASSLGLDTVVRFVKKPEAAEAEA